jgi:threonyl-tRNA synthetase
MASSLEQKRHSLAHLLAAAVLEIWPDAKPTIGPAVDDGFYYDFDFSATVSEKEFPRIEKKMREILKIWQGFEKVEVSKEEAEKIFAGNQYKLELISEIAEKGEALTLYKSGEFTDLCRGGHVENCSEIDPESFKLIRVAGAYWRGDEKNKMLTRIYGFAFENKDDLEKYIVMQEEAKKRDHKKLGKDLDLFVFSEVVGKGLPLWTEKGATVRRELERFIVDEEIKRGYKHVYTPDIAKLDLYKKSGHYPYYKDSMYAPIKIDDEEFMLRPMTCPHHFELYLSKPRSYKELPMRIAEMAKLYRYEQSGELSGLVRVRSFCLADAHIICKDSVQAGEEVEKALDLIDYATKVFGIKLGTDYSYRLSLGDRKNTEKYFDDPQAWDLAEEELRKVLQKRGAPFIEVSAEAAFYGPKIDIQMKGVSGKEDTAFTVQYDFVMPKRFGLMYKDSDGVEKEALVIHRSSIGAIERVMAFLIEKYAGAFPTWLAPVQVAIIPVRENHNDFAQSVLEKLQKVCVRAELMSQDENLGKKVRAAKNDLVPYMLIIGDKEIEAESATLESRDKGNLGVMKIDDIINLIKEEIEEKK